MDAAPEVGFPALSLVNGPGTNVTTIQGSTQIGTGLYEPAYVAASITDGAGPSNTQFNGLSSSAAEVYGGICIVNGATVPGQVSQVDSNATRVIGSVNIDNTDGNTTGGNSSVGVTDDRLGSHLTEGGPLVVNDGPGVNSFTMAGSQLPWGLYINYANVPVDFPSMVGKPAPPRSPTA